MIDGLVRTFDGIPVVFRSTQSFATDETMIYATASVQGERATTVKPIDRRCLLLASSKAAMIDLVERAADACGERAALAARRAAWGGWADALLSGDA